jgi:uncharacterized protein with HEPN domain
MDSDIKLIHAIIRYCETIEEAMERFGNDIDDFLDDKHYQASCSFCIDQIGENIKKLSSELRNKHPETDWKGLMGMRDVIAHGYHKIDLEELWITMTEEIPALKVVCGSILNEV